MSNGQLKDPDDFFADTRMSFGDHIEDLRSHLWKAIYGFLFALFFSFFIGRYVMDWITAPVKSQLDRFYDRRIAKVLREKNAQYQRLNQRSPFRQVLIPKDQLLAAAQGKEPPQARPVVRSREALEKQANPPTALRRWFNEWVLGQSSDDESPLFDDYKGPVRDIPEDEKDRHFVKLWISYADPMYVGADQANALRELLQIDSPTTLRAEEAFFVWFKVCLVTGFVLGSPWIFWQVWMFIAAGLYPHEKKLVHVYLPISLFLFLLGVAICEIFVIPKALAALLWFNEWLGFKPDIRLNDWLSFAIFMPLVFGLSFQTPMVMLFLNRLGVMDVETFRSKRRVAWFVMAVFAAVITPSTDAFSMLFLWVPMSLLFELGIILIRMTPPPASELGEDAPEADELVEV